MRQKDKRRAARASGGKSAQLIETTIIEENICECLGRDSSPVQNSLLSGKDRQ
jgi:hypothetical protein